MQNKKLASAIIRTAILFFVFVSVLTFYIGSTFGWFYQSDNSSAGGMNAGAEMPNVVIKSVTADGVGKVDPNTLNISFENAFPGESSLVTITVQCMEDVPTLVLRLRAPSGCDTPVRDASGKYYYFGSQIKVTEVAYDGTGTAFSSYLVANGWGVKQEATLQDIEVYSSAASKGYHTYQLRFTFENAKFDQSILKGFGKTQGQTSYRVLELGGPSV